MKCVTHHDTDAVAFCQSCGNGLCAECRVSITGISYCQPCLDAGRIRSLMTKPHDLQDRLPVPLGPVTPSSRLHFTLGIVGLLIVAVSIHIVWLAPMTYIPSGIHFTYLLRVLIFLPESIGLILVAIGTSLAGLAIAELGNYFNYRMGRFIGLFTIISPWILVISDLLIYTGLVYDLVNAAPVYVLAGPGPLLIPAMELYIIGNTLYGILFLLWSVALLSIRRKSHSQDAIIVASLLFLIVAHLLLFATPILILFLLRVLGFLFGPSIGLDIGGAFIMWHAVIIEPAVLIMAYIFNRFRLSLKL